MSFEVRDLREIPIGELTEQEIKSRLHLVRDRMVAIHNERTELSSIETALSEELNKRNGKDSIR